MSVTLAAAAAALFAAGTYLVLQRALSRVIIGLGLLSHGANTSADGGRAAGHPAVIGRGDPAAFSDPLAQALALTAIVITFGVSAFLLALAYRSWLLPGTTRCRTTSRTASSDGTAAPTKRCWTRRRATTSLWRDT